jgi:hypothetical protein
MRSPPQAERWLEAAALPGPLATRRAVIGPRLGSLRQERTPAFSHSENPLLGRLDSGGSTLVEHRPACIKAGNFTLDKSASRVPNGSPVHPLGQPGTFG